MDAVVELRRLARRADHAQVLRLCRSLLHALSHRQHEPIAAAGVVHLPPDPALRLRLPTDEHEAASLAHAAHAFGAYAAAARGGWEEMRSHAEAALEGCDGDGWEALCHSYAALLGSVESGRRGAAVVRRAAEVCARCCDYCAAPHEERRPAKLLHVAAGVTYCLLELQLPAEAVRALAAAAGYAHAAWLPGGAARPRCLLLTLRDLLECTPADEARGEEAEARKRRRTESATVRRELLSCGRVATLALLRNARGGAALELSEVLARGGSGAELESRALCLWRRVETTLALREARAPLDPHELAALPLEEAAPPRPPPPPSAPPSTPLPSSPLHPRPPPSTPPRTPFPSPAITSVGAALAEAEAAAARAESAGPRAVGPALTHAALLASLGRLADAATRLRAARAAWPTDPRVACALGALLGARGETLDAMRQLQSVVGLPQAIAPPPTQNPTAPPRAP
ncbi:hypothetical protein AB1Y20_008482 [Prymnesium parvum]|uniref:Anaphase-promoting complex subunit 5 n=1 Tax=Prymnesium parvum TaxID=97485 RepID=A0AB34ITP2_PRYPA